MRKRERRGRGAKGEKEKKRGRKRNEEIRMGMGREEEDRKMGEIRREERKGRKGEGKKRKAPKTAENRVFTNTFIFGGYCTHPIPYLGQMWQVRAGQWYTFPCQISS